jgi:ferredoxin
MKGGYAALFSVVLAYAAYQGATPPKPASSGQESRSSSDKHESFPTIAGGVCKLNIEGKNSTPCGDCKAVCPAKELTELIEDYFRAETGGHKDNSVTSWGVPNRELPNIQFVIASLPDPVHTHMALLFDRSIEAIESAAQASGFLFSRAWMPWDISTHNESTDFTVRLALSDYRQRVESLPGLMIFQKSAEEKTSQDHAILFVFVVGETPTGGLHVEQFQNALKIRQSILSGADKNKSNINKNDASKSNAKQSDPETLRIYGPTFSGSLGSLAAIVNSPSTEHFAKIIIRSGSVSSNRAVEDFCAATQVRASKEKSGQAPGPAKSTPDFATFQFSDTYQEYYLGRYFRSQSRHNLHSHIAILSEDETAFGNQENIDGHHAASPDFPFVRLYFPREIAQLRDAYQQNLKTQAQPANSNASAQPQSGLSLSLGVTGNDDDSVASYSPLQTPLSQESIMRDIVVALRKEHAKIVVIRAGDPLDTIFLARYLRLNYPQARLVTVGADLLAINAFVDSRFHGILAVTSYPLLTGTEFPFLKDTVSANTSPSPKVEHDVHRLFPDNYSVGEFNAFLSLLAEKPSDSGPTLPSTDYAQFGLPAFVQPEQCSSGPCTIVVGSDPKQWTAHLWLTVIGRDGYWPVAVLDDSPADPKVPCRGVRTVNVAKHKDLSFTPYSVHLSVGWTIFWTLSVSLTVLLAILLLRRPGHLSRSEILGRFAGVPSGEGNYLLFTSAMLLLIAQIILVFPATFWLGRFAKFDEGASFLATVSEVLNGLWLLTFGYFLCISVLGLACWIGFRTRKAPWLAALGAGVCSLAVLATILWTVHMWSGNIDTATGTFLYRYLQIGSGVSPCLPLLFLVGAWIWWCWESLSGVISTKEKRMVLPRMSDFDMDVPAEADVPAKKREPAPRQLKVLLFVVGAWIAWCWKSLSRGTYRAEKHTVPPHTADFGADVPPEVDVSPRKLEAADRVRLKALAAAEGQWPWKILGSLPLDPKTLASAFAGFVLICLLMRPSEIAEAFESFGYKLIYWILLYSCLLLVCYLATQIVSLWLEFRKQLRAIENVPFRRGFSDLRNLTWKPLWKLAGSGREKFSELLVGEVDTLNKILNGPPTNERLKEAIRNAKKSTNLLSEDYEPSIDPTCRPHGDLQKHFFDFQNQLATCVTEALIYANEQWKGESAVPASKAQDKGDGKDNDKDKQTYAEPPAADPATRAVEYFLCLFYLNVILIPLRRLQTLILAMAGVFVFVLISYSSYPFESRESFHALLVSIFFAISLVVAVVYGQMYSNPLLSRITNTKPGELGLDFWVRLGTFVFIPLLSLLSVQFPELNNFLFSWLQPALQSIK